MCPGGFVLIKSAVRIERSCSGLSYLAALSAPKTRFTYYVQSMQSLLVCLCRLLVRDSRHSRVIEVKEGESNPVAFQNVEIPKTAILGFQEVDGKEALLTAKNNHGHSDEGASDEKCRVEVVDWRSAKLCSRAKL